MKKKKRITAIGTAAVLLGGSLSVMPRSFAADDTNDDWLHVEGDKIVDMAGNEVWMTGCNWFGYNVGSQVFDGVWSRNMHEMLTEIADHGFNLLRVPMSTQLLLGWRDGEPDPMVKVNTYTNPELTLEGVEGGTVMYSFDIWNKAVEWCKELGIKIMIDIHSAETASAGHQVNLWYTDKYSAQDWCDALYWFADYYKNDDTILAIDLKNEPHGKADTPDDMAKWDDSEDPNNWKFAAETAASYVLKANPNLLVMVEGIEVYPKEGYDWTAPSIDYTTMTTFYYGAWWGANFRGAREYPIDLGEYQSQLVYSPHDYGPLVWEQDWFKGDFTTQTLLDDYWYDTWAYLCEEHISPLLMGEWGGFIDAEHDKDGKNTRWLTLLRDYMIEHHIHHTFWCFNENSGDTGGLVYDNFGTWDTDKYALVAPALWQDEDGVFVSLDHQRPLGSNGQSLSDYYDGSSHVTTDKPSQTTTTAPASTTTSTETTASVTGTETTAPAASGVLVGDVNLNDERDIADAVELSRFLVGDSAFSTDKQALTADCDGDTQVTQTDLTVLLRFLAGIIGEESLGKPQ